jgi:hypothetical protein
MKVYYFSQLALSQSQEDWFTENLFWLSCFPEFLMLYQARPFHINPSGISAV